MREARSPGERLTPSQRRGIRHYLESRLAGAGEYYFYEDSFGDQPYETRNPVFLLKENGRTVELSAQSEVIRSVTRRLVHARYYVPHEYAAAVARLARKT